MQDQTLIPDDPHGQGQHPGGRSSSANDEDTVSKSHCVHGSPCVHGKMSTSPTPASSGTGALAARTSAKIESKNDELSANQKMNRLAHHPDLPFLVTNWISQYAPPPVAAVFHPLEEEYQSNSTNYNYTPIEIEKREEAIKVIRESAENLARAFQSLGAFGNSSSQLMVGNMSRHQASYSDLSRRYDAHLYRGDCGPSDLSGELYGRGNCVQVGDKRVIGRVGLLDALISSNSRMRTVAGKNELRNLLPWSLLEAACEGSVPSAKDVDVALSSAYNHAGFNEGADEASCNASITSMAEGTSSARSDSGGAFGRRIGQKDADKSSLDNLLYYCDTQGSAIHHPIFLGSESINIPDLRAAVQASRHQLALRSELESQRRQLESTLGAIVPVREQRVNMGLGAEALSSTRTEESTTAGLTETAEGAVKFDFDSQRVLAHLGNQVREIRERLSTVEVQMIKAKREGEKSHEIVAGHGNFSPSNGWWRMKNFNQIAQVKCLGRYRNRPFRPTVVGETNVGLDAVFTQQYCRRSLSIAPNPLQTKLSILKSRLAHAVTISCHLIYPVYCLKFDRTGQYFITGADDQVVKVFRLAIGPKRCGIDNSSEGDVGSPIASNYCANMRGAVLVCTLRGHAGVVADIDVSMDNALLATASMDGDVRVWGMRDGCPVAILRGHKDGANMVSWSSLTPFRLVTCGEDGLARMWDIRQAALDRYGEFVACWSQCSQKCDTDDANNDVGKGKPRLQGFPTSGASCANERRGNSSFANASHATSDIPAGVQHGEPNAFSGLFAENGVLSEGNAGNDSGLGRGGTANFANANIGNGIGNDPSGNRRTENNPPEPAPGAFVANDNIDVGVQLLAQLQHGDPPTDGLQGRVTRTARKAVRVMCIARCPLGGHFATGTDDGLGHVWADEDDCDVGRLDSELSEFDYEDDVAFHTLNFAAPQGKAKLQTSNAPSKERLLATLHGHSNPVTDMEYSNFGDRLLTASMKEGFVCIWSWGSEGAASSTENSANASMTDYRSSMSSKFSHLSQLTIDLTPASGSTSHSQKQKKSHFESRPTVDVHCDGVAWTCDDQKVVTSQSSPVKARGITEIVPGSQMIYVWDSRSGKCLMGITSSHTSLCSAVAPHPTLPSVFASAGSDGAINVWDLDRGCCFFSHTNSLLHGPADSTASRGKRCGYLEIQFSPDGLNLVATDENGRVTVLDTLNQPQPVLEECSNAAFRDVGQTSMDPPAWMKEQYFAHDYYDLLYNANGYCVERGSELAPHIAPRGVRCTHEGVAHPEGVRYVYRMLIGPLPLPRSNVRWSRDYVRARSAQTRLDSHYRHGVSKKVRNPGLGLGSKSTAIITRAGNVVEKMKKVSIASIGHRASGPTNYRRPNSTSGLSNRYNWRDAYAELESDNEMEDQDDEDYDANRHSSAQDRFDENLDEISVEDDGGSPFQARGRREGGRQLGHAIQEPIRASSRHISQRSYNEVPSDDEHLNEMMSTHARPSGEYINDWTVSQHIFRMPRGAGCKVQRHWVSRTSQPSHLGKQIYCPQVGDSVVYIPRAHQEMLRKFPIPGYSPPWMTWPTHSPWPVVRCKVTHVRYRFPFEMYYRSRHDKLQGIAAIVTLEITGVPLHSDRPLPWPAPTFTSPIASRTRSCDSGEFEVTVFECNHDDFIVPEFLYSWRLQQLEEAIAANAGLVKGLSVSVYCPPDGPDASEDPEYVEYTACLDKTNETGDDEMHLMASGFDALSLRWEVDGVMGAHSVNYNAWEVIIRDSEVPAAPTMSKEVKGEINAAVRAVSNLENVKEWFWEQVDTDLYTDYLDMVEVPMTLSFIQKRFRCNYYSNKLSVLSDMELVKENCYKYNEDNNEYYDLACRMYDKFKSLVDAIEEPAEATSASAGTSEQNVELADNNSSHGPRMEARSPGRRMSANDRAGRRRRVENSDDEAHLDSGDEDKVRLSSRNGRRASSRARDGLNYAEMDSDEGEEMESSSGDESEANEGKMENSESSSANENKADNSGSEDENKADDSSSRQTSIRLRASSRVRKGPDYKEKNSDEDEYLEDSGSESEESTNVGVIHKKRKRGLASNGAQRKKRRTDSRSFPNLEKWPPVSTRKIFRVGTAVLEKLRDLDIDELFKRPVLESYPDFEDEYLQKVEIPMDFRTIEEDRLPNYGSIRELQDDLILTFRNCCVFNGEEHEYFDYAIDIWQQLNDIFHEVNNSRL